MKVKLLPVILILTLCFIGCELTYQPPQIPEDLCSEYDKSKSHLLRVAAENDVSMADVYYGLLDAAQIAMITDIIKKKKLERMMNELGDWYVEHYPVSWSVLVDKMIEAEKAEQLAGIVSRRVGDFRAYWIIDKYSDCMLRAGWKGAMNELGLQIREK